MIQKSYVIVNTLRSAVLLTELDPGSGLLHVRRPRPCLDQEQFEPLHSEGSPTLPLTSVLQRQLLQNHSALLFLYIIKGAKYTLQISGPFEEIKYFYQNLIHQNVGAGCA